MPDSTPTRTQGDPGLSAAREHAPAPPAARPTENPRKFLDGDALAGTKVLLVDDDYRNLFAIKALLERTKAAVKSPKAARTPSTRSSEHQKSTSS